MVLYAFHGGSLSCRQKGDDHVYVAGRGWRRAVYQCRAIIGWWRHALQQIDVILARRGLRQRQEESRPRRNYHWVGMAGF